MDFEVIGQYGANRDSKFKLPDYIDRDGEAAIFTILARAVSRGVLRGRQPFGDADPTTSFPLSPAEPILPPC